MDSKRRVGVFFCLLLLISGISCSKNDDASTWQTQYDLGLRFLEDGNYQEAIIAFNAAIEIDPNSSDAYIGRGNAYMLSGETQENLTAAQADYQKVIELDETNEKAWLGLAEVTFKSIGVEAAVEVLQKAQDRMPGEMFDNNIMFMLDRYMDELIEGWQKEIKGLIENGNYDYARELLLSFMERAEDKRLQETLTELDDMVAELLIGRINELIQSGAYDEAGDMLKKEGDILNKDTYDRIAEEIERRNSWEEEGRTVVIVSTTDELKNALEKYTHNSVIIPAPGAVFEVGTPWGDWSLNDSFYLHDLTDVIIWGDGTTELICKNIIVPVVQIENCTDVFLHGLILGHDPEVNGEYGFECPDGSDVLHIYADTGISKITVENCDLYGCGFCGVNTGINTELFMKKSVIHDCSMKIVSIYGKTIFDDCSFIHNAYAYPELAETTLADLMTFKSPYAIETYNKPLIFNRCVFENNLHPYFIAPDAQCEFNDCVFNGNAWG